MNGQSRNRRILLADDEAFITATVAAKLRALGDEVACAGDGEEALDLIAEFEPTLLVSDFQMPVLDGFRLACRLRENPATASLPIVMLTARGHALSPEELARTNIRAVLAKPFSVRELISLIDSLTRDVTAPDASQNNTGSAEPIAIVSPPINKAA
jgi:CheY-like chemotaxis protein